MAGIYIHIPYCRQKCSYCNFYFSVSMKTMDDFVQILLKEIDLTRDFLDKKELDSVYFGGGTPSVLSITELESIIGRLSEYYILNEKTEITLEANPDDISSDYIKNIRDIGITRFSLGVQSFHENELKILNRSHDANKALRAIEMISKEGFCSTNIDLIFGIPGSTIMDWEKNLNVFYSLGIPHLSCYNLTIEDKTAIYHQIKTGKIDLPNEKLGAEMFLFTHDYLSSKGYHHYEISNYATEGNMAIHNTNYWKGEKYLGLGPSAHSYNGIYRQWNISNVRRYIQVVKGGEIPAQKEVLTIKDNYNEYIMTGLRTKWGIELKEIETFGTEYIDQFESNIINYIRDGFITENKGSYLLTTRGMLYADKIASDLFLV